MLVSNIGIFMCLIYVWQKCVVWCAKLSAFDSAATMDGQAAKLL